MIHLQKKKRTEDCYQQSTMRFLVKDIYNIPKCSLNYYSISFLRGQINVTIKKFLPLLSRAERRHLCLKLIVPG